MHEPVLTESSVASRRAQRWAEIEREEHFGEHLADPGQFGSEGFVPTERFVLVEQTARGSNAVWVSQHSSPEEAARYHDEGEGCWEIAGLFDLDTGQRYEALVCTMFQPVPEARVAFELVGR